MRWEWLFLFPAVFLMVGLFDVVYLVSVWPDWEALQRGPIPKSRFIAEYEASRRHDKKLPALEWTPIAGNSIPKHVARAFIVAEDARFYLHDGIDLEAVTAAIEHNVSQGRVVIGASTISQQTVKNLLLSRERSLLRKWHELVLTRAMERHLSKQRILSIYLNIIELGRGLYGIEAGAQHYFGTSASGLTSDQAAALAATLPSPVNHNPATRTKSFRRRKEKVSRLLRHLRRGSVDGTPVEPVAEVAGHETPATEQPPQDGPIEALG
ncbi:MAG: monofunctional biosynthetic peptidoglycan transglycosylase, partial [Myxococcota bacterium]